MHNNIPNFKPYKSMGMSQYVTDCVETGWISGGKYLKSVKSIMEGIFNTKYIILVNSGTSACKLALVGCGIGKGDGVISPDFTYIATNNAILSVGAKPILVDVSKKDWNIDPKEVLKAIRKKRNAKCVMAVNLLGCSADYNSLLDFCKVEKIKVIEDNCQAIFSKYYDKYTGTIGDAAAFSFFANKIISCGEGGMVIFKSKRAYEKALLYKNQGRDYGHGKYYHSNYGENMNMTNVQAAILYSQLTEYKFILFSRSKIEDQYKLELPDVEFRPIPKNIEAVTWFVTILLDNRDKYVAYMAKNGVETIPVWKPNHIMPHLQSYTKGTYPNTTYLSEHGVMLPTYVGLPKKDIERVCKLTRKFIKNGRS